MTSANAAKGKRWELAFRKFLALTFGRLVRHPHQEGFIDVGDLHLSPFALQLKDEARHNFASYVRDAEKQAAAAEELFGVAVVKQRGKGAEDAYVVMSGRTFRDLVKYLHDLAEDAHRYRSLNR